MEFCSNECKLFYRKEGIARHHIIPHTPQQNGVAERMNRTIISKARCMLPNASMGRQLWAESASTSCYLINQSPSIAIEKGNTYEGMVW
jgi:transposase InsO family protein